MMGSMSSAGGIAGNIALPKPAAPEPPVEKREETFAGDMLKLWELLEQARSPEGMLVSKMREMECGTFIGKTVPDDALLEISRRFKLDGPAESKLSDVLAKYEPERK